MGDIELKPMTSQDDEQVYAWTLVNRTVVASQVPAALSGVAPSGVADVDRDGRWDFWSEGSIFRVPLEADGPVLGTGFGSGLGTMVCDWPG